MKTIICWLLGLSILQSAQASERSSNIRYRLAWAESGPTPLVTGNGLGFVTYSLTANTLTKFYAHPYRFEKPLPNDEWGEGIETTNFIKSLTWDVRPANLQRTEYLQDSQIINIGNEEFYFHPFGLDANAFVTSSKQGRCLNVQWEQPVRSQTTRDRATIFQFVDVKEGVLVIPIDRDAKIQIRDSQICGSSDWIVASLEAPDDYGPTLAKIRKWSAGLSAKTLMARELSAVENWRSFATPTFRTEKEFKLWRQSEIVLRMGQSREVNRPGRYNNGLILASLPEGMWFVAWVRDMAYATMAFIRMGHQEEARRAILAYFNARPVGRMQDSVRGFPYQISVVRYFGNGTEEPFFTMLGQPNIEFDNWGLVLWVLGEYVARFNDADILHTQTHRGTIYNVARDLIVAPLLGNLDPTENGTIVAKDTSIWEEYPWAEQHFAYSSAAAIRGLEEFRFVAEMIGDQRTIDRLESATESLRAGFKETFIHDGFINGTASRNFKNQIDSAVLEAINLGVVSEIKTIEATHEKMEELRMASGGYRRVRGDTDYEKHEFLYSNFSLARNHLLLGKPERSTGLIDTMIDRAGLDHNLIPEMYVSEPSQLFPGMIGDPTGSRPMVGYGAGAFVIYLLERDTIRAGTQR